MEYSLPSVGYVLKASRILEIGIIIFQVASIALFGLSLHSIISTLIGIQSEEAIRVSTQMDVSREGLKIILEANPRNQGFLSISLLLEVAIYDADNHLISRNSTTVHLDPGRAQYLSLTLVISRENLPQEPQQNMKGIFELTFEIKTLGDLIGSQNRLRITEV